MSEIYLKRGDTYDPEWIFKNDDGTLMDISGFVISSVIRDSKRRIVATMDCSNVDIANSKVIPAPFDTSTWPIGLLKTDIKIMVNGKVRHSSTQVIKLSEEET